MTEQERRHIAGIKAVQAGKAFETYIDGLLQQYRQQGLCVVEKTPEPVRVIKPLGKGQYVVCYTGSAQPDYKGSLYGGQTIVFDAKHTQDSSIYKGALTQNQADTLEAYSRMGAVAGVLVQFGTGRVCFYHWNMWKNMERFLGRKSIPEVSEFSHDLEMILTGPGIKKDGRRDLMDDKTD